MFKQKKYFLIIFSLCLIVITLSSLVNIYKNKQNFKRFFNKLSTSMNLKSNYVEYDKQKYELANQIISEGGYILHFRHAHREKWIDVAMYDSVEINEKRRAENEYFKNAVCLSSMGMIQAKMMGEIWSSLNVPVSQVISSPSCRARQTAEIVFGGYTLEKSILLHKGPYRENFKEFRKKLKEFYLNLETTEGSNIIVSAHNGLIEQKLFDKIINMPNEWSLEEGGFYVFKKIDNKLIYIDKFNNFQYFNLQFKTRPNY